MNNTVIETKSAPTARASRGASETIQQRVPPPQVCHLVVVFDGQDEWNRAVCLAENLHRSLGEEVELQVSGWKFSLLRKRGLRDLAADEVAQADLVIYSFGEGNDLPDEVSEFNELWPERRLKRDGLLGVLFSHTTIGVTRIDRLREYFAKIARKTGLDFLVNNESGMSRMSAGAHLPGNEKLLKPLMDEYFCPTDSFAS